jgi:hypothetical protein
MPEKLGLKAIEEQKTYDEARRWIAQNFKKIQEFANQPGVFTPQSASVSNTTITKTLNSNISADTTDIADLRLSNVLTIGDPYLLFMNAMIVGGDDSARLDAFMDGTTFLRCQVKVPGAGPEDRASSSTSLVFNATGTSITFNFNEINVNTLEGNGTTVETYVQLVPLKGLGIVADYTP